MDVFHWIRVTYSTLGLTTKVLGGNEASSGEEESSLHLGCVVVVCE
jgi:hypothetical protein